MNRLFYFLSVALLIFSSCDDDSESPNSKGELQLGDRSLAINYVALEGLISVGNTSRFTLSLFDQEIEYENLTTELQELEVYLLIDFFSKCADGVVLGEFEYVNPLDLAGGTVPENSYFSTGSLTTRDSNGAPSLLQVSDGTVTISSEKGQNEDEVEIEITFDLTFSDGTALEGNYKGAADIFGALDILEPEDCAGGSNGPGRLFANGQDLNIVDGIIGDYGVEGTHRFYEIILSSTEQNGVDEPVEGETYLSMRLASEGSEGLNIGRYDFSEIVVPRNYLEGGFLLLDFDPLTEISAGWVEISKTGDTYTIEVDLDFESGRDVTGRFSYDFRTYDLTVNEPDPTSNYFSWDGVTYTLKDLAIDMYGPGFIHYGIEFFLLTEDYNSITENTDFKGVSLNVNSLGTEAFTQGSFEVVPVDNLSVPNNNYALSLVYDNPPSLENTGVSGTVDIAYSEADDEFTISFTIVLDDDEQIQGAYSGSYVNITPPSTGRKLSYLKSTR